MLIEDLIRLGRPVLESGLGPREVLRLITDAADARVKNFYRHVIVVELPPDGEGGEAAVLPLQNWQTEQQVVGKKKPEIDVDVERALGVPVSLPAGGNPLNPQGVYGLPVYPVYDPHFQSFRKSADRARVFLAGRLERTPAVAVEEGLVDRIAELLHAVIAGRYGGDKKWLGVLVLARCGAGEFFTYSEGGSKTHIGASLLRKGALIEPVHARIAEAMWAARLKEGEGMGHRGGPCSSTGEGETAIAAYCKAWPWAFPTWTCPVPHGGDTKLLVEGIGLSEESYRALTLGANLFQRLTRTLRHVVLPELFAPVEDRDRQNAARNRKPSDLTQIFGSSFILPVRDAALADPVDRDDFAHRVLAMLDAPVPAEPLAERYLTAVTGFDVLLPDELNRDEFRLTLVYFSSGGQAADVHLRAYIQDVLPSTAGRLKKLVRPCREQMDQLMRLLSPNASDKHRAYLSACYQSVPYLLARGYGGSYLWTVLEQCLHRRPLDERPIAAHVAARIRSVVPRWPDSRFDVIDEVIFLMVCRDFIRRYNREVADPPKEDPMPMRPWRELLEMLEQRPPSEMTFQTIAELGFGCGALIHRFSAWYWRATKVGREGKDYLKHRVLTFGADLSPEVVWRAGLGKLCDVAARYETKDRRLGRAFRERLGVLLTELEQRKEQVKSDRDGFMTAFWAGYCLQGYDRPHAPKAAAASTKGGEG
jgi:hypothetical protein